RRPLHSLWVASSSTAICLPLLTWIINIFLGVGMISWVLVSTFGGAMFLWMYSNLLKVPTVQKVRSGEDAFGSSSSPLPPSSSIRCPKKSPPAVIEHQRLIGVVCNVRNCSTIRKHKTTG